MKKIRVISCLLAFVLTGCSQKVETVEMESNVQREYALVTKSQGNVYNELMAQGFQEVIEEAGGICIICNPEEATAEDQMEMLRTMISQEVDSIAVSANDPNALGGILKEAMEKGIQISTMDSDVSAGSRQVFVNQAATEIIGQTLMEAVYDIAGGGGQWAILSATSQATNQNAWIEAMRRAMEDEKYQNMRLVDIVYGNDEGEMSREKTLKLLKEYPDLEVICAPTVVGMEAVAQVLEEQESDVKATGLCLPSAMAPYVVGEDPVCPYFYLWNPIDVGRMSAYVSLALVEGTITGAAGETFEAGKMGTFEVVEYDSGSTEVIVAPPIRFNQVNIGEWKDLF